MWVCFTIYISIYFYIFLLAETQKQWKIEIKTMEEQIKLTIIRFNYGRKR